jgi:hypothetical protein
LAHWVTLPGATALFISLCCNIEANLKALQNLVRDLKPDEAQEKIRSIVENHIKIIGCVEKLNKIYSTMLNQMSIYYPIVIALIGYNIVTVCTIKLNLQGCLLTNNFRPIAQRK